MRYALYALTLGTEVERANRYIESAPLPTPFTHPYNDGSPNDYLEIYLKPATHRLLTAAAKARIEEVAFHWVNTRSSIDPKGAWPFYNPTRHVWYIIGSEGRHAARSCRYSYSL